MEFTGQVYTNPAVNNTRRGNFQYFVGADETGASTSNTFEGIKALSDTEVAFYLKEPMDEEFILTLFNRYFYILPSHISSRKENNSFISRCKSRARAGSSVMSG